MLEPGGVLEAAEADVTEVILELARGVTGVAEDDDTTMLELVSAVLAEDIGLVDRDVEL